MDMIQTESGIKALASEDIVRKQAEANLALAVRSPLYRKLQHRDGFRFDDWYIVNEYVRADMNCGDPDQAIERAGSFASVDWSGCKQTFAEPKPASPNAKPAIKLAVAPLGGYRGLGWCDE